MFGDWKSLECKCNLFDAEIPEVEIPKMLTISKGLSTGKPLTKVFKTIYVKGFLPKVI